MSERLGNTDGHVRPPKALVYLTDVRRLANGVQEQVGQPPHQLGRDGPTGRCERSAARSVSLTERAKGSGGLTRYACVAEGLFNGEPRPR